MRTAVSACVRQGGLLSARIAKRMRVLNLRNPGTIFGPSCRIRRRRDAASAGPDITNVTSFFREPDHSRSCRNVCAAGSPPANGSFASGLPPVRPVRTLFDGDRVSGMPGSSLAEARILATDISTRVLASPRRALWDAKLKTSPNPCVAGILTRGAPGTASSIRSRIPCAARCFSADESVVRRSRCTALLTLFFVAT